MAPRAGLSSPARLVMFDVMAGDGTYFVLTMALRDFASRQRREAGNDGGINPASDGRSPWR
jgi:hypothetical protein